MMFPWKEEYATGHRMIDDHHKELFKAINDLMDACKSGQGNDRLSSTMKFLMDYTIKHFNEEEKLQQKYHYPDYPNHHKLHESFKNTVSELAKKLQAEGPTTVLVAKISLSTGEWLIKHIANQDKKVAAHLHSHGG
jgi:hemerythrin